MPFGPAKLRFDIVMDVFFEVLVPKAASPKGAPWEAGLYVYVLCACVDVVVAVLVLCKQVYSNHGAKHLEARKAHRKFFMSKAHKFLKDNGLA